MNGYKKLLLANKAWVKDKLEVRPDYFARLADDQQPDYLWIGCSDSRVPAEEVTGSEAGELFVHRNVGNQVIHTDSNLLSVLEYAVKVLQVKHVIVCGHYGCGGVKNAMSHRDFGIINKWLRHIRDIYRFNRAELDALTDDEQRYRRLVELNVIEQVWHVAETSLVQSAWHHGRQLFVHGWVYDLHTGYLNDLLLLTPETRVDEIYRFDFSDQGAEQAAAAGQGQGKK